MSAVKGIALITGSAQGLGRSIALRLAKDGFDIALNDIPSKLDQLRAVATDIESIGRRAHIVPADVSVEEEVKGMIQNVVNELGGLDVMVANAGVGALAPLIATELDQWERVMAVNTRGVFLCYKYAAQQMIKQGRGGRIIGASSILGKSGYLGASAYSASKFAVRGLTQTAALELGKYDITVNSYAPGLIRTEMTAGIFEADEKTAKSEILDAWKSLISNKPIKHDGRPEDIASIISYLASKEAYFITGKYPFIPFQVYSLTFGIILGQSITVDGGLNLS